MEKEKAAGRGLCVLGGGIAVASITYYFIRTEVVREYIREVEVYRKTLIEAYKDGEVSESERRLLESLESEKESKERTIRETGLIAQLRNALRDLGIFVGITGITASVVIYMWRRYRPPGRVWECPKCKRTFTNENALHRHLDEEHSYSPDPYIYTALIYALDTTPVWFLDSVAVLSGIATSKLRDIKNWWNGLSGTDKVLFGIILAVIVLLIVMMAWWLIATSGVGAAYSAAISVITA